MVSLEVRGQVDIVDSILEEEIDRQVAEIMEATKNVEEQPHEFAVKAPAWNFSMPFAGVRYYSYE